LVVAISALTINSYVGQYQNRTNVLLLLGFDLNANPVEILYNELEDDGRFSRNALPEEILSLI